MVHAPIVVLMGHLRQSLLCDNQHINRTTENRSAYFNRKVYFSGM